MEPELTLDAPEHDGDAAFEMPLGAAHSTRNANAPDVPSQFPPQLAPPQHWAVPVFLFKAMKANSVL